MAVHCRECGQRCEAPADMADSDMDVLVDHLTDEHDAFSYVTAGRPLATDGGAES